MRWPGWRRREQAAAARSREVAELHDPYHERSRVTDGEQMLVAPQKVLHNIELMMERVDNDIDVPVAFGDIAAPEEIAGLIENFAVGPVLCGHIVNTGARIMLGRYPEHMARAPLPPQFDLRRLTTMTLTDHQHDVTRAIVDCRAGADEDLDHDELRHELRDCSNFDQIQIVMALFATYGLKVGAIQHRLNPGQAATSWSVPGPAGQPGRRVPGVRPPRSSYTASTSAGPSTRQVPRQVPPGPARSRPRSARTEAGAPPRRRFRASAACSSRDLPPAAAPRALRSARCWQCARQHRQSGPEPDSQPPPVPRRAPPRRAPGGARYAFLFQKCDAEPGAVVAASAR